MLSSIVHLPNRQTIVVSPVFGGLFFKFKDLDLHHTVFPPGWTIVIQTEDDERNDGRPASWNPQLDALPAGSRDSFPSKKQQIHRFRTPTCGDDYLFLSSISNPSNTDFKPAVSQTRSIAMMLWATLYWYFQQPEPDLRVTTDESAQTAEAGKPKKDWRIYLRREGVFRGKYLLQKLERMGLISCEDSTVGVVADDRSGEGWQDMFVSRRAFWQLDPRIFLFTFSPAQGCPFPSSSPYQSRPASPSNGLSRPVQDESQSDSAAMSGGTPASGLWVPPSPHGPFESASHLPTYFPPPPSQYTFTNNIRHPIRPKPPRQGETFYTRYISSVGQYLSFRVPSIPSKSLSVHVPSSPLQPNFLSARASLLEPHGLSITTSAPNGPSDVELLHQWMNNPRVAHFWGEDGPQSRQEEFLKNGLRSRHSFPVIGCWDGKPFGYIEIYWVREDKLGRFNDGDGGGGGSNTFWDRGIHCLVGEQEFRGPHRLRAWMSALVHYCFLADYRTQSVLLEPRIDNER
ncbi:MAG: hypothetical protein M1815_000763 [Lichina confinis]|nr:MAG: hypothetical protein M1815_000763 [Lichina confinis]